MNQTEDMRCLMFAGSLCCEVVPCQANLVRTAARLAVAKKYGIEEDVVHAALVTVFCCCCADGQVQNEIMVRENLTYGCAKMVPDTRGASVLSGAPGVVEMVR